MEQPRMCTPVKCNDLQISQGKKDVGNDKRFSGVLQVRDRQNRFNGLPHTDETVETVLTPPGRSITSLKRGVNESQQGLCGGLAKYPG